MEMIHNNTMTISQAKHKYVRIVYNIILDKKTCTPRMHLVYLVDSETVFSVISVITL